jgi:Zn-finger nucleic acid-binding protein
MSFTYKLHFLTRRSLLFCPVCKKSMIILEYDQVEIDYCPSCAGCWLDQGELELLLEMSGEIIDFSDLTSATRGKRRCPRCRKKLLRANFPKTNIEVDICTRDGGIWLDRGELIEIAQSYGDDPATQRLKAFFGTLFKQRR